MRKIALALAVGLLTVLPGTTPAAATPPQVVDPATVTPPLNPDFAPWSCFATGNGSTCQGAFAPSYENVQMDFSCNGQPVYLSGSGRERMTRWHDAQGRATKTHVHLDYPQDRFSLSPTGDGPFVAVRGHWNRHYTYLVPGNLSSRVMREVGAVYLVTLPGQGIVVQDTGLVVYDPDGSIRRQHGVHDVLADPAGFVHTVCGALT